MGTFVGYMKMQDMPGLHGLLGGDRCGRVWPSNGPAFCVKDINNTKVGGIGLFLQGQTWPAVNESWQQRIRQQYRRDVWHFPLP